MRMMRPASAMRAWVVCDGLTRSRDDRRAGCHMGTAAAAGAAATHRAQGLASLGDVGGSTALHWVAGRAAPGLPPNGVEWVRWLLRRRPADAGLRDSGGEGRSRALPPPPPHRICHLSSVICHLPSVVCRRRRVSELIGVVHRLTRFKDETNRNVGESQSLLRFLSGAGWRGAVPKPGRTALDHARRVDNPVYIGMMQQAVEAACTYRGRYILTEAARADVECGAPTPWVVHAAIDRRSGMRVCLRCGARTRHPDRLAGWLQGRPAAWLVCVRRVLDRADGGRADAACVLERRSCRGASRGAWLAEVSRNG
jgi:hypothetical protein